MPMFDYECKTCQKVFEWFVRKDDPPVLCPGCRSERVVVVYIQAPGMLRGFHPYSQFRNVGEDYGKTIQSVVPKSFKGSK